MTFFKDKNPVEAHYSCERGSQCLDPAATPMLAPEDRAMQIQSNPIGLPEDEPPKYLPQDEDTVELKNIPEPMGAIGPWATGRVDWGPLAGMTGIRPVVDHYTITRYSTGEWRTRNEDIITRAKNSMIQSQMYVIR